MKLEKKHYISLSITIVSLLMAFFCFKYIIQQQIEAKIQTFSYKGLHISYKSVRIYGLNTISFSNLSLITPQQDTLFNTDKLHIKLSAWKLLKKEIDIRDILISNSQIKLRKDSVSCNYCFLLANEPEQIQENNTDTVVDFSAKANRIGKIIFNLIPKQLQLDHLNIDYKYYQHDIKFNISTASISNGDIQTEVQIQEDSLSQKLTIKGYLDKEKRLLSGQISNNQNKNQPFTFPFVQLKYNALIRLKNLDFKLNFPELSKTHSIVDVDLDCTELSLKQPRLADTTIFIPQIRTDLYIDLTKNRIEISPASLIQIDSLKIHPQIELQKDKAWKLRASVNEQNINAQDFLNALPEGLFGPVKTVKTTGAVDYHFLLDLDMSKPDSLTIESGITKRDFKIVNPGVLARMNNSFLYTAYEDGKPFRSFIVGSENPNFTPASVVSPLLINAILQSEDGQFFYHKGFRLDAIKEALAHDIKVGKFARGGSTISMQIVKNVFLDRNKNIARKLEEAMIVWLIESNSITSKQRMFDVYLNIIEWGPGIYGVKEASEYYFKKSPAELTLDEAIFMASIIPRPKKFFWSLAADGKLRESQYGHFRIVRNRLIRNGIIQDDSINEYIPHIDINGSARSNIYKGAALPDSMIIEKIDSIENNPSYSFKTIAD